MVGGDGVEGGFFHFCDGDGDFHADGASGFIEALEVLGEAEDAAVVDADALENTVAIEEAMIEHGDFGVFLAEQLSVEVDFHSGWRGSGWS